MSANVSQYLERLVTLFTYARDGAFAIALYDRLSVRREITAALRQRLSQPVYEVTLSEHERNPIDLIRALEPKRGDVVCLFDLERAFPEALGYLDLQREVLVDMEISLVCWTTTFEHRELARRAPNFYAFRTGVFDFTTAGELPSAERRFIGRQREAKELTQLFKKGGCVVLTGLGGIGKTALAQEVARETHSHFVGGAMWVNCETKPPLDSILHDAAVALIGDAARFFRPEEQRQRLDDILRDRPCLLVLDSFEFIAEDGEVLRWLKTIPAPSAALIVSRQSVPYLNAPTLKLAELPPDDAVELFTQRARDAGWEGADAEVVPRFCELVGHLPLAIELLAPRTAELPLPRLLERVRQGLAVLDAKGDPTRPERHQSVQACFAFSYERLSEPARDLLMRLSVLPDGAGEEVITAVMETKDWDETAAELVRSSMWRFEGGKRYTVHPLVQEFALEQLGNRRADTELPTVRVVTRLAQEKGELMDPRHYEIATQKKARAWMEAEWRNLLACAALAFAAKEWPIVIDLSLTTFYFWTVRGYWSDVDWLYRQALKSCENSQDLMSKGTVYNNMGALCEQQGQWRQAEDFWQTSLRIRRDTHDRKGEAHTITNLARIHRHQRQWKEAEEKCKQGLEIWEELGDRFNEGRARHTLGTIYQLQGRLEEAEKEYEQSLMIRRESKYRLGEGHTLNWLGLLYQEQKLWQKAEDTLQKSQEILRESDDRINKGINHRNLGILYRQQKRWAEAKSAFQQSLEILREVGDRVGEGATLKNFAELGAAQGDFAEALALGRQAVAVLEKTEDEQTLAEARALVAEWERQAEGQKSKGAER